MNGEALAEVGTLTNSGELLGRENVEDVAKAGCEDGSFALVDHGAHIWSLSVGTHGWEPHVHERKAKPEMIPLAAQLRPGKNSIQQMEGCSPKLPLGPDTEILQYEPYAYLVGGIVQAKGTSRQTADEIASKHALWLRG